MLENEYIENLVDKFTNIINEATAAKNLYVTLGQRYAEGEESKESITNWPEVNHVQDLEDELNRINNMTYSSYAEMVNGAPTEDEFKEWKNTRVEALQNLIEEERVNRDEDFAHMENAMYNHIQNNMNTASDEYDKAVDELKKHVEKINTQIERTTKRIQIRIEELDEEIADIVDELRETNDHDEKIRLSKELENYRAMKVSYENNLAAINEIRNLPNEILNSIEDYDKAEELLATATEKANEINGRLSIATNEIQVNVSYNEQTGKYIVECSSGNFRLSPGKEYSEEELTRENIGKLLKGFVGALANNRVALYKNGTIYMKTSFENAASNIVEVAKDMDKTVGAVIEEDKPTFSPLGGTKIDFPTKDKLEEDKPTFNPPTEETVEPPVLESPGVETKENTINSNSNGLLNEEEKNELLAGMGLPKMNEQPTEDPTVEEIPTEEPTVETKNPLDKDIKIYNEDGTLTQEIKDLVLANVNKQAEKIENQEQNNNIENGQPEPNQAEPNQAEPNQAEPNQAEPNQPKPEQPKPDTIVLKVIKTRNALKRGASIVGTAATVATTAVAGMSLLGVTAAGVAAYGVANALVDAAAAYKSNKIRKTLSDLADKYGLIVNVDRKSKSVYFCSEKDLSTRITSEDLKNPNPEVRKVAEGLQRDLDEAFENDKRNIADSKEMENYDKEVGFLTRKPPLEFCQKVTLDNVEAAYQQIGGVYSIHDKKRFLKGKFQSLFQQDAEKIATNFSKSMQPEKPTEVIDVDFEELEQLEKEQEEQTQNKENSQTEEKEETEEKTQDNSAPQQDAEEQKEQQENEPEQALDEEEKTAEESKKTETVENHQEDKEEPTLASDVDVDNLDNAGDLLNFMNGMNIGDKIKANSSDVHKENTYEQMLGELEGPEKDEERGRTL